MKKHTKVIIILILSISSCNKKMKQNCDIKVDEVNQSAFDELNIFLKNPVDISKLDSSIYQFNKVLECDTVNFYAFDNITLCYLYKKDYKKALELNKKAIEGFELNAFFLKSRGTIYEYIDNQDSSKYFFNKALKLNIHKEKNDIHNINIKVEILFLLNKLNKKQLAIEKLNEYLKEYPDNNVLKSMIDLIQIPPPASPSMR